LAEQSSHSHFFSSSQTQQFILHDFVFLFAERFVLRREFGIKPEAPAEKVEHMHARCLQRTIYKSIASWVIVFWFWREFRTNVKAKILLASTTKAEHMHARCWRRTVQFHRFVRYLFFLACGVIS
jgi:hypothetical protein